MASEQVSMELLRGFSPLDGLKRDNLAALARKVQIRELSPGQLLFKEGDTEKRTIYIVSGLLELVDQSKVVGKVEGGSEMARNPVAPVYPRRVTAKARDRVRFISIDSDLLDVMLTWDQTGTYEVSELQGKSDQGTHTASVRQRRREGAWTCTSPRGVGRARIRLGLIRGNERSIPTRPGRHVKDRLRAAGTWRTAWE